MATTTFTAYTTTIDADWLNDVDAHIYDVVTVTNLPAGVVGLRRFVYDASVTTFASIVAGGGSNSVPVYYDGTNWRIG